MGATWSSPWRNASRRAGRALQRPAAIKTKASSCTMYCIAYCGTGGGLSQAKHLSEVHRAQVEGVFGTPGTEEGEKQPRRATSDERRDALAAQGTHGDRRRCCACACVSASQLGGLCLCSWLLSCSDRRCKGGTRRKSSRRTTSFGPTDVFVGIICDRTRQKRSLVANGFD
jgi:hypothetical protein